MLSTSPNLISGGLAAANNLSDLANAATARTNLGVLSKSEVAALRNALAPRGGVALDGTSGARVVSTLTGQSIGTDPFSIAFMYRVPSTAPSAGGIILVGTSPNTSAAAYAFGGYHNGSDNIEILIRGANPGTDYNRAIHNGLVAAYGGKWVHIVLVRPASGNLTMYVNGVSQTLTYSTSGSAPGWQGTVSSTYFSVAYGSNSDCAFSAASLYNCALSAADIQEIYELGGAVPERFKFGSQNAVVSSNFSAGADGWTAPAAGTVTGNTDGIGGQDDVLLADVGAGAVLAASKSVTLNLGKRYSLSFSGYIPSTNATGVSIAPNNEAAANIGFTYRTPAVNTWVSYSEEVNLTASATAFRFYLRTAGGSSVITANDKFYIKNIVLKQLGAVVHLPLNDGIGYQLHDESTNKLDAVMTTTGVSHILPQRQGYVRGTLTWSATHEGKSLIGQRALPSEAVVERITRKATAGSSGSGCTIGTTNSATRWQALDTFTTAKEAATLANTLPAGTADADNDIVVDPDTANFTGSIEVEAHYSVSEGTP